MPERSLPDGLHRQLSQVQPQPEKDSLLIWHSLLRHGFRYQRAYITACALHGRQIKTMLSQAALSAIRFNPILSKYYLRLFGEDVGQQTYPYYHRNGQNSSSFRLWISNICIIIKYHRSKYLDLNIALYYPETHFYYLRYCFTSKAVRFPSLLGIPSLRHQHWDKLAVTILNVVWNRCRDGLRSANMQDNKAGRRVWSAVLWKYWSSRLSVYLEAVVSEGIFCSMCVSGVQDSCVRQRSIYTSSQDIRAVASWTPALFSS